MSSVTLHCARSCTKCLGVGGTHTHPIHCQVAHQKKRIHQRIPQKARPFATARSIFKRYHTHEHTHTHTHAHTHTHMHKHTRTYSGITRRQPWTYATPPLSHSECVAARGSGETVRAPSAVSGKRCLEARAGHLIFLTHLLLAEHLDGIHLGLAPLLVLCPPAQPHFSKRPSSYYLGVHRRADCVNMCAWDKLCVCVHVCVCVCLLCMFVCVCVCA